MSDWRFRQLDILQITLRRGVPCPSQLAQHAKRSYGCATRTQHEGNWQAGEFTVDVSSVKVQQLTVMLRGERVKKMHGVVCTICKKNKSKRQVDKRFIWAILVGNWLWAAMEVTGARRVGGRGSLFRNGKEKDLPPDDGISGCGAERLHVAHCPQKCLALVDANPGMGRQLLLEDSVNCINAIGLLTVLLSLCIVCSVLANPSSAGTLMGKQCSVCVCCQEVVVPFYSAIGCSNPQRYRGRSVPVLFHSVIGNPRIQPPSVLFFIDAVAMQIHPGAHV